MALEGANVEMVTCHLKASVGNSCIQINIEVRRGEYLFPKGVGKHRSQQIESLVKYLLE